MPDDEDTEDTDILNVKKDSDEVKSSFEKRQEKVIIRNLKFNLSLELTDY